MENLVVVKHGLEPALIAYEAIQGVFTDDVEGKRILLKPNVGRKGPAASGICTHPEVIRGLIKFFQDKGATEIFVGEGPLCGVDAFEALEASGIRQVCQEMGVFCINLDDFPGQEISIPQGLMVEKLVFTSFLQQIDLIVSVPVMKTHMYTGVTLSIKNMKGCLYKKEKTKLHRIYKEPPDKSKGLTLDYGIADLATVLMPNYAVIDGIVGMEGFGPSIGTPKALNVVVASKNPIAADLVAVRLMGMEWDSIPHLNLIQEKAGLKKSDVNVDPEDFLQYGQPFLLASADNLKNTYPQFTITEKGSCSACSAAIMAFLKTHGKNFTDDFKGSLASGKDLEEGDLAQDNTFLIGNCSSLIAKKLERPFCRGCPPVGSNILAFITGEEYE